MKNKKYGLITIMQNTEDDFEYTHIIFCKDNEISCFIMNQDEFVDLTIEELIIKFTDRLLTKNKQFKSAIFETDDFYIDLKEGLIQFPQNVKINFYISQDNKHFLIYDNIEKEEFLNEFGLRDVDEEWLKIREFCEQQNLTFEEIKERLERNE